MRLWTRIQRIMLATKVHNIAIARIEYWYKKLNDINAAICLTKHYDKLGDGPKEFNEEEWNKFRVIVLEKEKNV